MLHRALAEWGSACDVIAPSLIPKRSGVHRKHDKRDAADLARLYRAGELVAVRIPSEADERVRDVVQCRETFQREILKSRHYILKFLATRGFVFREGTNWCTPHLKWLQHLTTDGSPVATEDRLIYREYHALLQGYAAPRPRRARPSWRCDGDDAPPVGYACCFTSAERARQTRNRLLSVYGPKRFRLIPSPDRFFVIQ